MKAPAILALLLLPSIALAQLPAPIPVPANATKEQRSAIVRENLARIQAARAAQDQARASRATPEPARQQVEMTVDQLAASPFTVEGALVKLTGIYSVGSQEVRKGVYEVTITGRGLGVVKASMTLEQANLARFSPTLYVTVETPDKYCSTVKALGNALPVQGLNIGSTPVWK